MQVGIQRLARVAEAELGQSPADGTLWYSYVEVTSDMRQNTWIECQIRSWDFFAGVAVRRVCDNLKSLLDMGRPWPKGMSPAGDVAAGRGVRGATGLVML